MIATLDRDRLLTIMRHKNHGMAQIHHMIALLNERSGRSGAGRPGVSVGLRGQPAPSVASRAGLAREFGIYENALEG